MSEGLGDTLVQANKRDLGAEGKKTFTRTGVMSKEGSARILTWMEDDVTEPAWEEPAAGSIGGCVTT